MRIQRDRQDHPGRQVSVFTVARGGYLGGVIAAGSEGKLWFTASRYSEFSGFGSGEVGRIAPGLLVIEVATTRTRVRHGWAELKLSCEGAKGTTCSGRNVLRIATTRESRPGPGTGSVIGRSRRYSFPAQTERQIAVHHSNSEFLRRTHRGYVIATATAIGGERGVTKFSSTDDQGRDAQRSPFPSSRPESRNASVLSPSWANLRRRAAARWCAGRLDSGHSGRHIPLAPTLRRSRRSGG